MSEKSFLSALFDFSFDSMITVKLIRLLYAIALIGTLLATLGGVALAFSESTELGIAASIASPLGFFIMMILVRVYLESMVVLFKIAENTAATAQSASGRAKNSPRR